eukprot:TRINITY_DN7665_c0_g1_i2.p1 TRINITY_DN7665_c0_g1~~TRINITY_DN7665_c0_g1_i2.p1  ORF type:complete len:1394 (+),score=352.21 TRINITY_DN7665_c0_g1_i2:37-4218(+)
MVKGNVQVAVRVRPLNELELSQNGRVIVGVQGDTVKVKGFDRSFVYDRCLNSGDHTQIDVYNGIGRELTQHALEGFNTCILAYGQTGSGKTHTMMGQHGSETEEGKGVIPRMCNDLFTRLQSQTEQVKTASTKCEVSFFEIYNERVNCLLGADVREKLKVREHPVTGPYVEGLTKKIVTSYEDVFPLIAQGNLARTVAETRYNQQSSRSHAVFTIIITQTIVDVNTGQCIDRVSRVNLVDLAGSERLTTGQTSTPNEVVKDGININKSLSTLGRVIHALSERDRPDRKDRASLGESSWVAYRDSLLTWLLKENLGGNSKTVMLACISPSDTQFEETLNTLRYADRVKRIRNNAIINEDQNSKLIRELYDEIKFLRNKLEEKGGASSPHRRASYTESVAPVDKDWKTEYWAKLDSSEDMISELNSHWERKVEQTRQAYQDQLVKIKNTQVESSQLAPGCPIEDTPLLVSLDPHLVPGEFVTWSLLPGDTIITTEGDPDDDEEDAHIIRLTDGVNICFPHCLFTNDNGAVRLTPGTQSITFVDGQLLTSTVELGHASRIIFGSSHAFYFLNPLEAKKLREARPQRIPKVLDWAYASEEFAQVMECYKPYEDVIKLQDEVEYWRSLSAEGTSNFEACAACSLLLVSEPKFHTYNPKPGLIYPLHEGTNKISAETWGLKELGEACYIEVVRGQLYKKDKEGGQPHPLWHGMRLTLGQSVVIVNCPCSPIDADMVPRSQKGPTSRKGHISPKLVKTRQISFKEEEAENLIHSMMALQYQMLAMHDVLYSMPSELAEMPEEELEATHPPEVVELLDFKRALKNFELLETPMKHLTPLHFRDHLSRLTYALRDLTHQFTYRLDCPPEFLEGYSEGYAHEEKAPVPKEQPALRERATPVLGEFQETLMNVSSSPKENSSHKRKVEELENNLQEAVDIYEAWQKRAEHAERELSRLHDENKSLRTKLVEREEDDGVTKQELVGELDVMLQRLRGAEADAERSKQEMEGRRQENGKLVDAVEHLRHIESNAAAEAGQLKHELTEAYVKLEQFQKKMQAIEREREDRESAKNSQNVERELQDTVSMLSEVAKKDKKMIKKLQQQLAEANLTMKTMQNSGVHAAPKRSSIPSDQPNILSPVKPKEGFEQVVHHIKCHLFPLGLFILPIIERVGIDVQAKGSTVAYKAWQVISKAIEHLEAGAFDRTSATRALRELAVYADMAPSFETTEGLYNEVGSHCKQIVALINTLKANNNEVQHVRSLSPRDFSSSSFTRVQSGESTVHMGGRDSPLKKRSNGNSFRGASPVRHPSPLDKGRTGRRSGSASKSVIRKPSPGPGVPASRPVGTKRSSSRQRPPSIDFPSGVTVPATTSSLRSTELHTRTRSESSRRRADSPRTQLAARLLQR